MSRVKKSKATKKKAVVKKKNVAAPSNGEGDVYGASGGMPFASQAVLGDRSFSRHAAQELSWAEFDRQVQDLARKAVSFKPEAVVGIAHGGVFVGGAVASALKVEFFPVRLTRRSRDSETRLPAGLSDDMPKELSGKRVLVVDDICSSGDSLEMATRLAKSAGATKVKTAALVTRPKGARPDFTAFTTETFFVFPWDYQAVVEDERFETQKPVKAAKKKKSRSGGGGDAGGDDVVLGV
ncbi:MAG: phosphoribosyl transferase [Archangiaceae bacterium]|nr:phosphoribosyl transferase [Archangiaceae bacterium]